MIKASTCERYGKGAQTITSEETSLMPERIPLIRELTDSLLAFIFQFPATIVFRILIGHHKKRAMLL
jgi:hypothetical protein